MVDAHSQLKITSQAKAQPRKGDEPFLDDFQQTLNKFGVPAAEQAELKTIAGGTRSDIVVDSPRGFEANA